MKVNTNQVLRLKLKVGLTIREFCKRFLNLYVKNNDREFDIDRSLGYKIKFEERNICSGTIFKPTREWEKDFYKTLIKNKIIEMKYKNINDCMMGDTPILTTSQVNFAKRILKQCMKSVKW